MKTLRLVLWHFPFFGFVLASATFFFGFVSSLIYPIKDLGFGLVEIGDFLFNPTGKVIVKNNKNYFSKNEIKNRVILVFYFPLALLFASVLLLQIIGLHITIVGAPIAKKLSQAIPHIFNPIEKYCLEITIKTEKLNMQK